MTYTPDPKDATAPLDSDFAGYMAAEFRALKGYIQSVVTGTGTSGTSQGNNFAYSGSYRNRLYNGTFGVQQRLPTDTTVTDGNTEFVADRWAVSVLSCDVTCQPVQSGTLDGDYYLVMTTSGIPTSLVLRQRIESADCKDLKQDAYVTISGMLYYDGSIPANPVITLVTPDTNNDDYGSTTQVGTATVVPDGEPSFPAFSWTPFKISIKLTGNAYRGLEFRLAWSTDVINGYPIQVSRLQLEIGAYNTPYERVPLSVEYLRCRRFYQQNDTTLAGTATAANQRFTAYFSLGPMFRTPDLTYIDTGLVNGTHDGEEVISNTACCFIKSIAGGDVFCAFSVQLDAEI